MKTLIGIQREAEKRLGIYTLSTDYEIVYSLMDLSDISPEALHRHTRLSSTAFYNKIKALERTGAILSDINPKDRRGRLYRLSESMRKLILNQQKGYMDLIRGRTDRAERKGENLNIYHTYIHKGKIVNHLTAEFQILLYLYLKSGISNINISNVVDVSVTKFNTSLMKLLAMGLVKQDKDPSDGRSKLYHLSEEAHSELDSMHEQVIEWIEKNT